PAGSSAEPRATKYITPSRPLGLARAVRDQPQAIAFRQPREHFPHARLQPNEARHPRSEPLQAPFRSLVPVEARIQVVKQRHLVATPASVELSEASAVQRLGHTGPRGLGLDPAPERRLTRVERFIEVEENPPNTGAAHPRPLLSRFW